MIYILSLGSNVDDKMGNLKKAATLIAEKNIKIENSSSFYLTTPVDYHDQSSFVNISLLVSTSYPPSELLTVLKNIEKEMGRKKTVNKGPRNIDIDIIFFSGGPFKSPELTIPHKETFNRLFVLIPTLEILEETDKLPEVKKEVRAVTLDNIQFKNQKIERIVDRGGKYAI